MPNRVKRNPPDERRDEKLQISVNAEELRRLEAAARRAAIPVRTWIRSVALKAADKAEDP